MHQRNSVACERGHCGANEPPRRAVLRTEHARAGRASKRQSPVAGSAGAERPVLIRYGSIRQRAAHVLAHGNHLMPLGALA